MRYQMRSIPIGKNFRDAQGDLYVRIPEMILEIGRESLVVNCMSLGEKSDLFLGPPTILGGYFHPDTVVEVVEQHRFLSKKEFDEQYKAPQPE